MHSPVQAVIRSVFIDMHIPVLWLVWQMLAHFQCFWIFCGLVKAVATRVFAARAHLYLF